ncbi:hypothetical protein HDK77DRAFT_465341 [Phyllosticta capitalensis]
MRKGVLIFFVLNILVIGLLVRSTASRAPELPAPNSGAISERPQLIPKIIHQTYVNETIPERWVEAQRSCMSSTRTTNTSCGPTRSRESSLLPSTHGSSRHLIGYEFPIQRADSIRYFVLAHYGGIYIDLDDGCNRRLDPSPLILGLGPPHGAYGHLQRRHGLGPSSSYNRNWLLPYITVMGSTGPLFLSIIWRHYTSEGPSDEARVRVLFGDEYNNHPWSFFTHHLGNSWHGSDVRLIFWMGRHWFLLTALGFIIGFAVIGSMWWFYRCMSQQNRRGGVLRFVPFLRNMKVRDSEYELLERDHKV